MTTPRDSSPRAAERTSLVIVGCGAQGRVTQAILETMPEVTLIGFVDDDATQWGRDINGVPVLGGLEAAARPGIAAIPALGQNDIRRRVTERLNGLGIPLFCGIHATAAIARTALIGPGSLIAAQVVVNTDTIVGDGAVINNSAVVEHDCVLGDFVNISPGAQIGGRVIIDDDVFIATGAIVLARRRIGKGAIVGAGALVTNDVAPHTIVFGIPARFIRETSPSDWRKLF